MKSLLSVGLATLMLCRPSAETRTREAVTVRITHPARDIRVPYNTEILFAAELAPQATSGTIEFLVNAKNVATQIAPPYRISLTLRSDRCMLQVRAKIRGRVIESVPVVVQVESLPTYPEPTLPELAVGGVLRDLPWPAIQLVEPKATSSFVSPANVRIAVDASERGGRIARVEFFEGSRLLGSALSAPWLFVWKRVPSGDHVISATAIDDSGHMARTRYVLIGVD